MGIHSQKTRPSPTHPPSDNPCTSCGACCAFFRVAFYWRETEEGTDSWKVPLQLTTDLDSHSKCMIGTEQKHRPKCIALKGKIGEQALCSIYPERPTPCRNFQASYFKGIKNIRCDEARKAHGLPPLRREDWPSEPTAPPPPEQTDPRTNHDSL